jgi:hypothetical protein
MRGRAPNPRGGTGRRRAAAPPGRPAGRRRPPRPPAGGGPGRSGGRGARRFGTAGPRRFASRRCGGIGEAGASPVAPLRSAVVVVVRYRRGGLRGGGGPPRGLRPGSGPRRGAAVAVVRCRRGTAFLAGAARCGGAAFQRPPAGAVRPGAAPVRVAGGPVPPGCGVWFSRRRGGVGEVWPPPPASPTLRWVACPAGGRGRPGPFAAGRGGARPPVTPHPARAPRTPQGRPASRKGTPHPARARGSSRGGPGPRVR